MSIRTIYYTIDPQGISPQEVQNAGLQGEDMATQLVFCLTEDFYNTLLQSFGAHQAVFRVDPRDGAGGFHAGETLTLDEGTRQVTYSLPGAITCVGGVCRCFLVISAVDTDNQAQQVVYSFPAVLHFAATPRGSVAQTKYTKVLSGLEARVKQNCIDAQIAADTATSEAASARINANAAATEAASASASATAAAESKKNALASANTATANMEYAEEYAKQAYKYANLASDYSDSAQRARDEAQGHRNAAETAKTETQAIRDDAIVYMESAYAASNEAMGWANLSKEAALEVIANQITSIEQTAASTADGGENVWTATFGDNRTEDFTVLNGSKGSKGDQGIQGEVGPQGPQGEQGIQGIQGEKGDKGDQGEPGEVTLAYANKHFANALKGEKSGTSVRIENAEQNPLDMALQVKVESKNKIPYPFTNGTATVSGTKFTDNGDGTITVSIRPTQNINYTPIPQSQNFTLPKGTYFFRGVPNGWAPLKGYAILRNETDGVNYGDIGSGKSFTLDKDCVLTLSYVITTDFDGNAVTFSPQVEIGTTATEFTPYVADLNEFTLLVYNDNADDCYDYSVPADGVIGEVPPSVPESNVWAQKNGESQASEGVIITATYNKDINYAFAELQAAIISLGGNV